jgi:hypothetical protein
VIDEQDQFLFELKTLEKIGIAVGDLTDAALLPALLEKELGHQPTKKEIESAEHFVVGNQLSNRNLMDHPFFIK